MYLLNVSLKEIKNSFFKTKTFYMSIFQWQIPLHKLRYNQVLKVNIPKIWEQIALNFRTLGRQQDWYTLLAGDPRHVLVPHEVREVPAGLSGSYNSFTWPWRNSQIIYTVKCTIFLFEWPFQASLLFWYHQQYECSPKRLPLNPGLAYVLTFS